MILYFLLPYFILSIYLFIYRYLLFILNCDLEMYFDISRFSVLTVQFLYIYLVHYF